MSTSVQQSGPTATVNAEGLTAVEIAARNDVAEALKKRIESDPETSSLLAQLSEEERRVFWTHETRLRFVIARDKKLPEAEAMLRECLAWRVSFKPFALSQSDVGDILALGTVFICGRCQAGRPVMYMMPGAKNPFPAEKRVQLMVFLLEETFRRGYDKLTWVFDFSRMGERGRDDEAKVTRKQTMHILQNYYPERLGALHMLNTPWYFNVLATLVWPFINVRTRAKIDMKCTAELLRTKYIAPEQLITAFGGTLDPGKCTTDIFALE